MAKFPTTEARPELGFTPTTGVRARIDVRQGDVGGAIGQALLAGAEILQERSERKEKIRVKNRTNLDVLSAKQASNRRDLIKAEIATMKEGTPPENWEEETIKIVTKGNDDITGFDFSPEESLKQQIMSQGDLTVLPEQSFAAAAGVISEAAITTTEETLTALYREGDSQKIAQGVIDSTKTFRNNGIPAKAILLKLKAAQEAGEKGRNEDAVKAKQNQASLDPIGVTAEMVAEQELRKQEKGIIPEKDLTNKNLETIIDYASSVGDKIKTESQLAASKAIDDSYAKIIAEDADISAMATDIQTNPQISGEDSISAINKITAFFSKWNSPGVADVSDEDIYDELTQASESVERGAMSPQAFEDLYVDKKEFLTTEDQRDIRSKDIVATRTMQNRAFTDALFSARPTLVELTESELGSLKLAIREKEIIKDLPAVNFFNIAIKKNQAERWNMGRFRKQLRSQIAQNEGWSQKQIYVAEEVLTDQLDLPVGELLKEFDAQNPNSAILSEPPDSSFKDIWKDLSQDDRATIWSERIAGTPTSVLLGSEEVLKVKGE